MGVDNSMAPGMPERIEYGVNTVKICDKSYNDEKYKGRAYLNGEILKM